MNADDALRRMLGVDRTCGLLLTAWNALIGSRLLLIAREEIHAEKENGQESQEPCDDSPVAPRHNMPL